MDWPTLATSFATTVSTIIVGGGLTSRRTRKMVRALSAQRDQLEEAVWSQRSVIRRHNADAHVEDPERALQLQTLPDWLTDTDEGA